MDEIPSGPGWQYEPKWDGFRCLAFRDGDQIELQSKNGQPLARYFPEVVEHLRALPARSLRARRRDRHPGGRPPLLRRSPPAHPPGREPDRAALAGAPGDAHRLRPAGGRRGARRWSSGRSASAGAGSRPSRPRPCAGRDDIRLSPATEDAAPGPRVARHGGRHARRHRGQAARPAVPDRRAHRHAEGEAPPHRGLRGGRVPLRLGLAGGGLAPARPLRRGRAAPSRRLHVRLPGRRPHDAPGQAHPADQAARLHGTRAGRAQPLEHRALGGMAAARARSWSSRSSYDHFTGDRFRHATRFLRWRPDKAPRQCTLDQVAVSTREPGPPGSAAARRPGSAAGSPRTAPSTSRRSSAGTRRRAGRR